jgi:predicted neuraminidase
MKLFYPFLPLVGIFLCCTGCGTPQPIILQSELLFADAPFAQCHASTIAEVNGTLLVAYFGGTHERNPDVSIYLQRQEQGGWSVPHKIADGVVNDTLRYPTWNPVLFFENDNLVLHYKMGPSPTEWWGMYITSHDEGRNWSKPKSYPEGFLGPIKNKPIRTHRGTLLYPSSVEYLNGIWKAHIERLEDGGKTFSKIEIPSPDSVKVIQPTLLEIPNKGILALLRSNQNRVLQSWSADDGKTWSAVTPTDLLNPNSGIDAVATTSGKYLLVNNTMKSGDSWEVGRNKLYLYASEDCKNWKQVMQFEDQESGEFSYPAVIEGEDGNIHITYTYNREAIKYLKVSI